MLAKLRRAMAAGPTPQQERAARAWRDARTGREAWARFRAWLGRTEPDRDGDATGWCDESPLGANHVWTHPKAIGLVLFEKYQVMGAFVEDAWVSDWATRWRVALAAPYFYPRPHDVALVCAYARRLGGPVGIVADLDPHGLHLFGTLRSGKPEAPAVGGKKLKVEWLGLDDEWLRRARRTTFSLESRTLRMPWVEREYWAVIKRMMPGVRALVGEQSFELLESGFKVETDGFRDVMVPMLRARLKRWK
jgi:hypothetical protein